MKIGFPCYFQRLKIHAISIARILKKIPSETGPMLLRDKGQIDNVPMVQQEETKTKLTLFVLDIVLSVLNCSS
jgi:hypothetical protein